MIGTSKRVRFSLLMFLQYFPRGAWFVTLGTYLGKGLEQPAAFVGFSYSLFGIAAILSPFFVGMVADRYFQTQRVLAVLHIAAAILMFALSHVTDPTSFLWVLFIYCLIYTPTESLSTSVTFHHLPRKYFPIVRLFGTLSWVAAGLTINFGLGRFVPNVESTAFPLVISSGASFLVGLYSLSLPKTAVPRQGEKITFNDIISLDALKLLKQPSFSVFMGACLLIGIPIQMYFAFFNMFLNEIGVANVASKMTLGQVSEAMFMVLVPFLIFRVGLKWMMALGLVLWGLRFFMFSGITVDTNSLIIISILIHGACYDFFNVTGAIYVDLKAGEKIRAAAQGLFVVVFLGFGKFFGSNLAGIVGGMHPSKVSGQSYDWGGMFRTTGIITVVIAIIFILAFHEKQKFDLKKCLN